MPKRKFTLLLFLFVILNATMSLAQGGFLRSLYGNYQPQKPAPLSADFRCGRYGFNEALFDIASGVQKHPGTLTGYGCAFELEHPISKTVFVSIVYSQAHGGNNGSYLTDDAVADAASQGALLTGVDGYSVFTIRTLTGDIGKIFPISHSRFTPFIKGGLGRGRLTDGFNGQASVIIPGYGLMKQPATDHGVYPMWVPTFSVGTFIRVSPRIDAFFSGDWNTGKWISVGIRCPISLRKTGHALKKIF